MKADELKIHLKHPKIARNLPLLNGASTYVLKGFGETNSSQFYQSFLAFSGNSLRSAWIQEGSSDIDSVMQTSSGFKAQFGQSEGSFIFDQHLAVGSSQVVFRSGNDLPEHNAIIYLSESSPNLEVLTQTQDKLFAIVVDSDAASESQLKSISQKAPVFTLGHLGDLFQMIVDGAFQNAPPLKGVILAGGKSSRMRRNKAAIAYHGKPQAIYMAELLERNDIEAHISIADEEQVNFGSFPIIQDRFLGLGPLGAICSAFLHDPSAAWFVLACDLPFIDSMAIDALKKERAIGKLATSYSATEEAFPEPLISIYEPFIYQRLLQFLSLGYACPRKVLINSDVKKVVPKNLDWLRNVNTPEDFDLAVKEIKEQ